MACLSRPLVAPVARLLDCPAAGVEAWLATERDRPGAQEHRAPAAALRHGVLMALAEVPPDIGFVLGQIWRKWQGALRRGFNPEPPAPQTARAILSFDEGLKRYSYGPPVRTARELLMLIEAGLVDLLAAEDPDILLTPEGWQLVEEDATAHAQVMVDAVLPAPDLERLDDPLLAGLRDAGRLILHGEGLAARIRPDGRLLDREGQPQPGLSLLGRLALGSMIAVDSVHDCFGRAAHRWARTVLERVHG
ncbi:MAG: hypothetical protein QM682_01990 [Paracoccus sp. (in: a-proteobacteria)]|uniref:hypothetical protein n=1 Tax=Paracoccus sp. TaxID=267 RepID=UPI0039E7070F